MTEVLANEDVRRALGGTVIWEELRGNYAEARELAKTLPLERAIVDCLSGRCGAARRALLELNASSDEPTRTAALRLTRFADALYFNCGPGGEGAMFDEIATRWDRTGPAYQPGTSLRVVGPRSADELRVAMAVSSVLSSRSSIAIVGRRRDPMAADLLAGGLPALDDLAADLAQASVRPCSSTWIALARADLQRRAGDVAAAIAAIRAERERCESVDDVLGAAACWLAEGDAIACATDTPLTIGLALEASDDAINRIDWRVERLEQTPSSAAAGEEAAQAYREAKARYAAAPRAMAAIELRLAALASLAGRHDEAGERATAAELAFLAVGDECGRWLARVHAVLADVARCIFVDAARVREIGTWGAGDGNFGYALGLGCMLARAARRWLYRDAGYEQAVRGALLAAELYDAAGMASLASQAFADVAEAHQAIGDRAAAATSLSTAVERLASAKVQLPSFAIRRASMLYQSWSSALGARDPDGMERFAGPMTELVPQVEAVPLAVALAQAVSESGALVPQYRAAKLEVDPVATDEQRERAWDLAAHALESVAEPQRSLLQAVLLADRGDRASGAQVAARYFANQPGLALPARVIETLPPALKQELQLQQLRRARLALTLFSRLRDPVRARAAVGELAAAGGDEWWGFDGPDGVWLAMADEAELLWLEGRPREALAMFERAVVELERRGATLRDDTSKTAFADSVTAQRLFVSAARTALAVNELGRAFAFIEHGKARALADLVAELATNTPDVADPIRDWREATARRDLKRSLLALEQKRPDPSSDMLMQIKADLATIDADVARLEKAAREHDPERFARLDARAAIAPLDRVTSGLRDGVVVIELALAADTLIGWTLERTGMTSSICRDLDDRMVRRLALGFQRQCARPGAPPSSGAALAELLVAPFAQQIRKAEQVVFIASGELARVPFHALPFDDVTLGERVAVSYAPSAGLLSALASRPVAGRPALVVGDPSDMSIPRPDGTVRALPALPGARREAEAIARELPESRILVGEEATREAVRELLPRFRTVQLATHGIVDQRSPWLSSIALAHGEQLTLADLVGIRMDADLVVLSACETGIGELTHGEEVIGMARGLLAAGARCVIVSLWSVYDEATRLLMVELHTRLQSGMLPAEALRAAQRSVREFDRRVPERAARGAEPELRRHATLSGDPTPPSSSYAHPAYWAPFIVIGA